MVVVVRSVDTIDLIKIWRAIRGFPFLLIVTSLTTTTTSIAFDRSTLNKAGRRGWNYLLQNDVYHTTTLKSRRGFPSENSRKRKGEKDFIFIFLKWTTEQSGPSTCRCIQKDTQQKSSFYMRKVTGGMGRGGRKTSESFTQRVEGEEKTNKQTNTTRLGACFRGSWENLGNDCGRFSSQFSRQMTCLVLLLPSLLSVASAANFDWTDYPRQRRHRRRRRPDRCPAACWFLFWRGPRDSYWSSVLHVGNKETREWWPH